MQIVISREELARAITRGRLVTSLKVIIVSAIVAAAVAAGLWWFAAGQITGTVRGDVRHAAVINCRRTNRNSSVGPALKRYLSTDAQFNAQLGRLDVKSGRVDHDLATRVAALKRYLPQRIATDYLEQSQIFQKLARKRAAIANLWAGIGKRRGKKQPSLEAAILLVTQAHCDQILQP